MTLAQDRQKLAVETGYWHLWRYDPALRGVEGKNPFTLDSKAPTADYDTFLKGEVRYTSLYKKYSEEKVSEIFKLAHEAADERYQNYVRLANQEQ